MTVEAISLALQVLITEFGAPEIIACDKEGALRKIDYNKKAKEALEAKQRILSKFSVRNEHFSTGLVERKMRNIHDWIGKLNMQGFG